MWAIWKAAERIRKAAGVEDFDPHDLRRTAASNMTSMGIPRLVVSKILNHAEKGVTAVYDRHSYDAEKRHALDAWAAKLQQILDSSKEETSNVVALRG
jgi:integrase